MAGDRGLVGGATGEPIRRGAQRAALVQLLGRRVLRVHGRRERGEQQERDRAPAPAAAIHRDGARPPAPRRPVPGLRRSCRRVRIAAPAAARARRRRAPRARRPRRRPGPRRPAPDRSAGRGRARASRGDRRAPASTAPRSRPAGATARRARAGRRARRPLSESSSGGRHQQRDPHPIRHAMRHATMRAAGCSSRTSAGGSAVAAALSPRGATGTDAGATSSSRYWAAPRSKYG